tara:strand:- start:78 stop:677 length:600 start_codon:yes stop_codon:yes gene_type:complete
MSNPIDNSAFSISGQPLEQVSSNVEMVGINTVSDAISSMNNGLLNDVSLVRTKDISMVPSESAMFVNFEENAIKGIHEETGLSSIYFSTGNMELLQKAIRYEVQQKTGKIIDKQSPNELSVVMRSIYLQNGNPMVSSNNIASEIRKLNTMVIDYCSEQISTQVLQHEGYIQKLTNLPVPIERPQQVDRNNFTYDISNLL